MKSNPKPEYEIILSNEALDDLSSIQQYTYETYGENQLYKYENKLLNTFQLLKENPEMGRVHNKKFDESLRAIVIEQHTVFYRIREKIIWIVRILHQRLDLKGFE